MSSTTYSVYIVSGRIKVVMDDGAEEEFGPGDTAVIPPGHNAWVVGSEPVVGSIYEGHSPRPKPSGQSCSEPGIHFN